MNNGFLSQEEIDSLLTGDSSEITSDEGDANQYEEILTDLEKDLLGEVGNISMGSASTALSQVIGQKVNITTPVVSVSSIETIQKGFEIPYIALDVNYTSGIDGSNLLVMKVTDAAVIANLMMGGDGKIENPVELSEIEVSAVSEAMNQMIGSAATSMATMFAREVNISPPKSEVWEESSEINSEGISPDEPIVQVLFKLTIGDLVDSNIMQILPINTARKIISIMMGTENGKEEIISKDIESPQEVKQMQTAVNENNQSDYSMNMTSQNPAVNSYENNMNNMMNNQYQNQQEMGYNNMSSNNMGSNNMPHNNMPQNNVGYQQNMQYNMQGQRNVEPVNVQAASFQQLNPLNMENLPNNIDLILDVPLQVSVVLGRAKLSIKEVLDLGNGSLIELDKLTEEPVEIMVNGKTVAYGEVVVVDENFGVRITNIASSEERIKSLGK